MITHYWEVCERVSRTVVTDILFFFLLIAAALRVQSARWLWPSSSVPLCCRRVWCVARLLLSHAICLAVCWSGVSAVHVLLVWSSRPQLQAGDGIGFIFHYMCVTCGCVVCGCRRRSAQSCTLATCRTSAGRKSCRPSLKNMATWSNLTSSATMDLQWVLVHSICCRVATVF